MPAQSTLSATSTDHATEVATRVLAGLEAAWNAGDGAAFGAWYGADASFVTIRGQHLVGADAIGAGHAGIFGSIYAGSVNRMALLRADEVVPGVVRAVSLNTLDCPGGPLAGVHSAMSTSVVARSRDGAWTVVATHNTLVAG